MLAVIGAREVAERTRHLDNFSAPGESHAAGTVVSSAAEMANWLRTQLAGGRFAGRAVLAEPTVAEMHAPLVDAGTTFIFADSAAGAYGLGWSQTTFD